MGCPHLLGHTRVPLRSSCSRWRVHQEMLLLPQEASWPVARAMRFVGQILLTERALFSLLFKPLGALGSSYLLLPAY